MAPTPTGTIGSQRVRVAELERRLVADGALAQRRVAAADALAAHAARVEGRLRRAGDELAADRHAAASAGRHLAAAAVAEYVDAGSPTPAALAMTSGTPSSGAAAATVYASAAAGALATLVTAYRNAEHRVAVARVRVARELALSELALGRARVAEAAASRAVHADNLLLASAKADLRALLAAAAERAAEQREAEQRAAAHPVVRVSAPPRPVAQVFRAALASSPAPAAASPVQAPVVRVAKPVHVARRRALPAPHIAKPAPAPVAPPVVSVASGYVDPLRGIAGLSPSRIDQGVDYCGYGPIYALGDGVVESVYNGGWPGGTYIAYQLSDGPAAGLTVYAAEDINPSVSLGEDVTPETVLGTVYEGPTCMETGWADGGAGDTMAMASQQFYGSNSTAFGYNFSQLLQSLGAPGGELQGSVTGLLPPGWPGW